MSFFSTPSPADRKVESATSDNFAEVPLELHLEIAEDIARSQDAGAAYLKAIRKRLSSAKSAHVQFLTLSLLDVAVKNGGDGFHETVSSPDFLASLSQLATSTKTPHVRDQALTLIQTWAKAFPSQGLHSFAEVYSRLRNKGVPFPDDSAGGVVFTPPINLTVVANRHVAGAGGRGGAPDRSPGRSPSRSPGRSPKEEKDGGGGGGGGERAVLSWASPVYVSKVKGESGQVLEYLHLFLDLIAQSAGDASALRSNESIQSLHSTLLDCRNRVSHLLAELDEEVLVDVMIQLSEAIRLTLEYYNAKLKGLQAQPPVIDTPQALRKGGEEGKAEGKEGKEEAERVNRLQPAQSQRPQMPPAPAPAAAPAPALTTAPAPTPAASALSQFDPLA